jgi:hypothetical protein
MPEASDIAVYQKLSEMADELDAMVTQETTLVGNAALSTAARTVRGMATAIYQHIMSGRGDAMDS